MSVTITIPLKTISETNAREFWALKARRVKLHRTIAANYCRSLREHIPALPLLITFTRYGKRKLDSDNLAASFKACRDGVADALGIDDGDERLTWEYQQAKAGEYSIKIQIEPRTTALVALES